MTGFEKDIREFRMREMQQLQNKNKTETNEEEGGNNNMVEPDDEDEEEGAIIITN